MSLQEEIDRHRKEIHTDGYQMSIGEILNLYRDGELDIHPAFQRFFRWTAKQKSRWIESILLGIPLPSIFVAQRDDGVWDVIDGLQRLSTILEFVGELKDEKGAKVPALPLEQTKLLPSLAGRVWSHKDPTHSLTDEQQRFIKRAKLDVKIVLRESHESSKYELFRRLNTGGTFLSDQELRSAFLVGANRRFYDWLLGLTKLEEFQACLPLTENQRDQQYDVELAIRFIVFRSIDEKRVQRLEELGEFLTDEVLGLAADPAFAKRETEEAFKTVFGVLAKGLESDSFRRYDRASDRFSGAFLISAYEVIAVGLASNHRTYHSSRDAKRVMSLIKTKVWAKPDFLTSSGVRATQRLPKTIALGRRIFGQR